MKKNVEAQEPKPAQEPTEKPKQEYTVDPDGWELEYDDE